MRGLSANIPPFCLRLRVHCASIALIHLAGVTEDKGGKYGCTYDGELCGTFRAVGALPLCGGEYNCTATTAIAGIVVYSYAYVT